MKLIRIELAKSKSDADLAADVMKGLGYTVDAPEACRVAQVFDATTAPGDAKLVYRDPGDNEVWVVLGRAST